MCLVILLSDWRLLPNLHLVRFRKEHFRVSSYLSFKCNVVGFANYYLRSIVTGSRQQTWLRDYKKIIAVAKQTKTCQAFGRLKLLYNNVDNHTSSHVLYAVCMVGSSTWTIYKCMKNRLAETELWFLRPRQENITSSTQHIANDKALKMQHRQLLAMTKDRCNFSRKKRTSLTTAK